MNRLLMFVFSRKAVKSEAYEASIHAVRPFFCFLFVFFRWVVFRENLGTTKSVTALVPSETACLANSPGKINRTDVWISLDVTVGFLLYLANLAFVAIFSKMSLMKEFMMLIALEEDAGVRVHLLQDLVDVDLGGLDLLLGGRLGATFDGFLCWFLAGHVVC